MENTKESGAGEKPAETTNPNPNPNPNPSPADAGEPASTAASVSAEEPAEAPRRPFTALSQVDADLALARVLQEQERAYMMLRMNGDDYSSEGGSYDYEDEELDEEEEEEEEERIEGVDHDHDLDHAHDHDLDHAHDHPIDDDGEEMGSDYGDDAFDANDPDMYPGEFEDDEAFARALQDAEEREVAVRLMALAGLSEWRAVEHEEHGNNNQDAWQEVDPDEYSYEELVALGEIVGTESRGLSADTISSLPLVNYKAQNAQDGNTEQCVICRVELEEGESLVMLPCKHRYHPECINQWLQINKACPMCSIEVSTSGSRQA